MSGSLVPGSTAVKKSVNNQTAIATAASPTIPTNTSVMLFMLHLPLDARILCLLILSECRAHAARAAWGFPFSVFRRSPGRGTNTEKRPSLIYRFTVFALESVGRELGHHLSDSRPLLLPRII